MRCAAHDVSAVRFIPVFLQVIVYLTGDSLQRQFLKRAYRKSVELKGGICRVNTFFQSNSLLFLKSKLNQVWYKHFHLFYPDMFRSLPIIFRGLFFYTSAQSRDYCLYLNVIYNIKLTIHEYNSYALVQIPSLKFYNFFKVIYH
jgi:hypothetical protein